MATMTLEKKLDLALKCLRSIAKYGALLPSDGLALECLNKMGELLEPEGLDDAVEPPRRPRSRR